MELCWRFRSLFSRAVYSATSAGSHSGWTYLERINTPTHQQGGSGSSARKNSISWIRSCQKLVLFSEITKSKTHAFMHCRRLARIWHMYMHIICIYIYMYMYVLMLYNISFRVMEQLCPPWLRSHPPWSLQKLRIVDPQRSLDPFRMWWLAKISTRGPSRVV